MIDLKKNRLFTLALLLASVRDAMGKHWFCAAFALTLLAAGCGNDGTGPEGPSLTGTWTDTIEEIDGNTFEFQLKLSESGSSVSGNYTLIFGLPIGNGSVTGTHTHPDIRLSFPLTVNAFGSVISTQCTYTATVNDARTSMRGMLLCPEAVDGDISLEEIKLDLTLTKQGAGSSSRTLPKRLVPESEQLPAPMYVRLEVFTLPGQRIATLASGSWKYVVLWDVSSGQEKVILEGHTFDVNS